MKKILMILSVFTFACQPSQKQEETVTEQIVEEVKAVKPEFPENLEKVLEAHGGFDQWNSLQQLSYVKGSGEAAETQLIDLKDRRVLLTNEKHQIGFDGKDVWISPAENDYKGSPRFYHNLYFYFYAMPFVLADPGIVYEEVEPITFKDKACPGIKVSYNDGVGDSPKDNYILYYDPETYRMEWLMYTVTYRSQETSDRYSLINYSEWADVEGVVLPKKLTWYQYKDGQLGDVRNEAEFFDISVSTEKPADADFAMPEDAKIDPLVEQQQG